jgi:CRISPR-associated protein Cas2
MNLYLIAYDVSSPRRLRKVRKQLSEYGIAVQKSVFECALNKDSLDILISELGNIMERENDKLRVYLLCSSCKSRIISLGKYRSDMQEDVSII